MALFFIITEIKQNCRKSTLLPYNISMKIMEVLMKIISHRGFWKKASEKNSIYALKKSIKHSFGFETDLRDYKNDLVISHDIIEKELTLLTQILEDLENCDLLFAWNIKSDGLDKLITKTFKQTILEKSYFFDMSIPETLVFRDSGLNYLFRISEFESLSILAETSSGFWIDAFISDWWTEHNQLETILKHNKKNFIVSPELHNRDYLKAWNFLKKYSSNDNLVLCTDYPDKAEVYFNG
jgi:glycerophosphoryl diester phosphodiesterase